LYTDRSVISLNDWSLMPRHPTREDVLSAFRREALLAAAMSVFGESGFDAATMERIADEAGVAKGTTYLYYPSKERIYDAALSHGFAALDSRTREVIDRAPNFREAISAFMTARAEFFFEHRDFFRMYVAAMARQVTRVRPRKSEFQAMVETQTMRLAQAVARAAARGEIRQVDAAATAVAVFDLTRGLVARRMVSTADFDLAEDVAFLSELIWQGLADERPRAKGKSRGKRAAAFRPAAEAAPRRRAPRRMNVKTNSVVAIALGAVLGFAAPALAQGDMQIGASTNPFMGSAPRGTATTETIPLSVKDAVERALQHNLGLLLQEEAVKTAHGARWRALAGLLPDLSAGTTSSRQVINLDAYGFPGEPSIIGPFNVFDARVYASQPLIDLRALNDTRAASANVRAESLGVRTARDLVTLVAVNLYLESVAANSRIEAAHAQQDTAATLFQQASDMKQAGVVAGIDVLRAQVQLQNQRQRTIRAENDFEKSKLQLARAIGLPPGQPFTLTDRIPYAPLTDVTLEGALKTAFESRADYLAARERVAAAEASRRGATADHLPTLRLDADYGAIGQTPSDAHATFRVAAMVRVPIFDAGRTTAHRLESDAQLQRRKAELEDFRGRVEYDVRAALLDLGAARQQLEAAQANVTLAGQELEQARDRFAAGVTGNLEVAQAQEAVAAASESYIAALYAHNLAKASLARAVGTAEQSVMTFLGGSK
jgi:outer membrane protein TolC/AcrR family transcriptional regulator